MTKAEIRKRVRSLIDGITDKEEKSRLVAEEFLSLPELKTARTVALFASTETEPDTSYILSELSAQKKTVCLPRVVGKDMVFIAVDSSTRYKIGAFGIKEPEGDVFRGEFDVMAVPLVAFDENKNRLGHGKGYYDAYLSSHPCYTVGLAFSEQKQDVPVEPWDVPLNKIISH